MPTTRSSSTTRKKTSLSKKEQEQLAQAAVEGYSKLPTAGKVIVALIAIAVIVFLIFGRAGEIPTAYTDVTGDFAPTAWDEKASPEYYRIDGAAIVEHPDIQAGNIEYGGFDAYGRATWAAGVITHDMVAESAGWRADFTADASKNIAGWGHNQEVDIEVPGGETYHGWLFNRSHLVADSLGGYDHVYAPDGTIDREKSKSERKNLVTATRTQNVGANDGKGGMAFCENIATRYLSKHKDGTVYYSAIPVYSGNELLPRSVFVDMKSDDGSINMHVETYNAAKGYTINYADGTWSKQ